MPPDSTKSAVNSDVMRTDLMLDPSHDTNLNTTQRDRLGESDSAIVQPDIEPKGSQMDTASSKLAIFFHPCFSDGGVERTNIYLGKALIEQGYDVEFLTTQSTHHFREEVRQVGIRMVELGSVRVLATIGKVLHHLSSAGRTYDRVYFIGCQYYTNVVSMIVALLLQGRRRNIRFINSERNHFQEFAVKGGLKNKVTFFLVRHLYRFADVIVANAQETADDLSEVVGREVHRVYNPTINERIDALRNEPLEETWFTQDSRPCVIAIGRLSQQKDFSTLLRAFRGVRDRIQAKLVILGEGELRQELETEVRELALERDVYLPGFVENPYKFLAVSDVFVLSSRYEGLPNALIEAVHLGIPCVSTACKSGPREVLLNGDGGKLVAVGEPREMSEAILVTLTDRGVSKKKSEVAFSRLSRFNYAEVKGHFERVITQ